MLEFLQTGKALSVLAAIGMIGFVSKLITRSLYKRLLKETDNMATSRLTDFHFYIFRWMRGTACQWKWCF